MMINKHAQTLAGSLSNQIEELSDCELVRITGGEGDDSFYILTTPRTQARMTVGGIGQVIGGTMAGSLSGVLGGALQIGQYNPPENK